jgi:hypothetical protein
MEFVAGIIKRRVYRVRGANALWHIDGNENVPGDFGYMAASMATRG